MKTMGDIKHIVICADDFGMHPGIDTAVLQLAGQGRLGATSCLVDGASFARNAKALSVSGLQIGLHLNFTERLETTPDPAALSLPVSTLIARSYLRQLDEVRVRRQIVRQLDRFESVLGRAPDFVDGHQHVHQLPQIRQCLMAELVHRYPHKRLWVRNTRMGRLGMTGSFRFKAGVIQGLGAASLVRLARGAGFAVNQGFLGVYDFQGGREAYGRLLKTWLGAAGSASVLMCHPASQSAGDVLGDQRVAEFEVLADKRTAAWLEEYGLSVGGLSVDAIP
ncbi:MAG TPA: ChbG/HpnK family deacetylase [Burkholderiaceae bacterium]|nr:ChbG/HpnK family deacetylase [Burkholderiaceae bacterium]